MTALGCPSQPAMLLSPGLSVNAGSSKFPVFSRNLSDGGLLLGGGRSASLDAAVAAFWKRRLADGNSGLNVCAGSALSPPVRVGDLLDSKSNASLVLIRVALTGAALTVGGGQMQV